MVQKTPNKVPMGRWSLSEKRASLQGQGKNTPAGKMTPKSSNAKMWPTSAGKGKMGVQELKGMRNKKPIKGQEQDDDLDSDEEIVKKTKMGQKSSKGAKSNQSPKGPETKIKDKSPKRQSDSKVLYIGKLPKSATPEKIRKMSPDAVDCVMPNPNRQQQRDFRHAYLVFASEKQAEENYQSLQGKKFGGQLLVVDFVGKKSKNRPGKNGESLSKKGEGKQIDLRKLYIGAVPATATIAKVAEFFPKAYQVTLTGSSSSRSAVISFTTDKDANEAYEARRDIVVDELRLTVLHYEAGTSRSSGRKRSVYKGRMTGVKEGGSPQKRMKFEEESDE